MTILTRSEEGEPKWAVEGSRLQVDSNTEMRNMSKRTGLIRMGEERSCQRKAVS